MWTMTETVLVKLVKQLNNKIYHLQYFCCVYKPSTSTSLNVLNIFQKPSTASHGGHILERAPWLAFNKCFKNKYQKDMWLKVICLYQNFVYYSRSDVLVPHILVVNISFVISNWGSTITAITCNATQSAWFTFNSATQ